MRVRELVVLYRVRSDLEPVDCHVLDAPLSPREVFQAALPMPVQSSSDKSVQ